MSLHVAIAGWLLGPPSGANRRLLAVAEHAAQLLEPGERLTVLHGPQFTPPRESAISWRSVSIPGAPAWRRVFAERRLLPAWLRELGVTVFEHGFLPLPPVHVPSCLVVHDVRAAHGLTLWPRRFAQAVLRASCRRAAAIVTPSNWTAAQLRALAPDATELRVIPNGVDVPATAPPPPTGRPGHLLHVGHLEPRKNLDVVVRALALVDDPARPELHLAGRDAGERSRLCALADRLRVTVRPLGLVDDASLPELYAGARAVVVPSRHEGFGLCALEGLAHGRPVLAADAGALPEILGPHGTLLPPDDPAAWARAIAATAPDARATDPAVIEARRERARAFAWRTAAAASLALWRQLHARGPGISARAR
jgi:glycosyltransferase involved in cell wall biosynthesis